MKAFFTALCLAVAFSLAAQAAVSPPKNPEAATPAASPRPAKPVPTAKPAPAMVEEPVPEPPKVAAKAHILVEFESGQSLGENNPDERMEVASLTKIMTAYVVFRELAQGKIKLEDQVMISEKAWRTGGSKSFVEVNKRIRLEDLLKGMLIQSGNDASVALAEHIAGSEETFVQMMNREAQRLGMTNTHFANADGLPKPEHYSSARDMSRLAIATIRDFPDFYAWYSLKEFTHHGIKQQNRNRLLWRDESVDGIKTGHTEGAGYCLVSSAKRENLRMITVIFGAGSDSARAQESQKLLNYGFRFFESYRLATAAAELQKVRVWKGQQRELPVGVLQDLSLAVPRNQTKHLETRIVPRTRLMAPITQGQSVGEILVFIKGKEIGRFPLQALEEVPEGSWWRWLIDTLLLWFQ